jgi:hypothetical protein
MTLLWSLDLGDTQVSDAGVDELKKALPKLEIVADARDAT